MCLTSHIDIIETWKLNDGHRDIYYAKKCKIFTYVWRLEFSVKNSNMYEAHIFLTPLQKNIQIGNDSFVFKYPVTCKQIFQNLH